MFPVSRESIIILQGKWNPFCFCSLPIRLNSIFEFHFFLNWGDTSITARLQTRKFGQAPILLLLTPRQALSSHDFVGVHEQLFHVAGAGIELLTLGLQVQHSPQHHRDSLIWIFYCLFKLFLTLAWAVCHLISLQYCNFWLKECFDFFIETMML